MARFGWRPSVLHNEESTLKRLDLAHNGIGNEGCATLLSPGGSGASKSLKVLLLGLIQFLLKE